MNLSITMVKDWMNRRVEEDLDSFKELVEAIA